MEFILSLLRSIGMSGKFKGMRCLALAVFLVTDNEDKIFCLSKEVYPEIAREYNVTVISIERNIRTAIAACWERGGAECLHSLLGRVLEYKPTTSEMIDLLADYVRKSKK